MSRSTQEDIIAMLSQNPALLAAVMRQMVLEQLAVPKPPLYTRVETIELEEPEADARLTPARWREAFPDDVDTTGWCDEDYEELTMIYSCAEDRRNGQRYVASSTGLWKVLPPRAQAREICALRERVRVLEQQLGSTAASDSVGFPQLRELSWMPVLVCGSGGERRGRGLKDGVGAEAQMHGPFGSVVDKDGNVFLIDTNNHAVRKVAADSTVSTIAGGKSGYRDGVGREAQFRLPMGICMDKESGTIYVSDSGNNCLRVVTPDGVVSTLAGTPGREAEYADGVGVEARFNMPRGIAVDQQGNIIVADSQNFVIRKCTPAGVVTTIAGSAEQNGFADGHGPLARFSGPAGLAIDDQNNIIVADVYNQRIRMIISGTRFVITLVGTGEPGKVDGNGREAQVSYPNGICIGARGEILVTDSNRRCLRIIRLTLPWKFARVLYLGVLKGQYQRRAAGAGGGGGSDGSHGQKGADGSASSQCLLALLPVEGTFSCPILERIIQLTQTPTCVRASESRIGLQNLVLGL